MSAHTVKQMLKEKPKQCIFLTLLTLDTPKPWLMHFHVLIKALSIQIQIQIQIQNSFIASHQT